MTGPYTTITVRHYEAMLAVVKAAKELFPFARYDDKTIVLPSVCFQRLRDRLAEWEKAR